MAVVTHRKRGPSLEYGGLAPLFNIEWRSTKSCDKSQHSK
jgi:hypothetical protein